MTFPAPPPAGPYNPHPRHSIGPPQAGKGGGTVCETIQTDPGDAKLRTGFRFPPLSTRGAGTRISGGPRTEATMRCARPPIPSSRSWRRKRQGRSRTPETGNYKKRADPGWVSPCNFSVQRIFGVFSSETAHPQRPRCTLDLHQQ